MAWWSDIQAALRFRWRPGRRKALHERGGARVALGNRGEAVASAFLKGRGYRILDSNVALRFGELDLVAESPEGVLVFVEVKAGKFHPRYAPELHVDAAKRRKLVRLGHAYLKLRGGSGASGRAYRFDVVAVVFHDDGREPQVRHHVHAVRRRR